MSTSILYRRTVAACSISNAALALSVVALLWLVHIFFWRRRRSDDKNILTSADAKGSTKATFLPLRSMSETILTNNLYAIFVDRFRGCFKLNKTKSSCCASMDASVVRATSACLGAPGSATNGQSDNLQYNLSHVGQAAYKELQTHHGGFQRKLWNVSCGKVVGAIQHTPRNVWDSYSDPPVGHSNWFPEHMGELISRTTSFCDIMSFCPPDGLFLKKLKQSIAAIAARSATQDGRGKRQRKSSPIRIRIMFGNVITAPCDCDALVEEFTKDIVDKEGSNIELWVGAWRKDMCWNHAKLIAVDGKYLHTGGHNMWDPVYLEKDPIHDTSVQLEGPIALEGHRYADAQWEFVKSQESSFAGKIVKWLPDSWLLPTRVRVTMSGFPKGNQWFAFPLSFEGHKEPVDYVYSSGTQALSSAPLLAAEESLVPILSLGRYGNILNHARASDDALIAMFDSANTVIRLLLQDLGPVNKVVAGHKIVYKTWPKNYLSAFGRALWTRDVTIDIVLSNIGSGEERGNYSNGWTCARVAAEILKTIQEQFPEAATDKEFTTKVMEKLRVCFMKTNLGSCWQDGNKQGVHSKFFIIDDVCSYVGSQNLYMFDLAEWGVVIDDSQTTHSFIDSLWTPIWAHSYKGNDCCLESVGKALKAGRDTNYDTPIF